MKRFTLRKVKQHSYSRQGWRLSDLGHVFAIYDREWEKNADACGVPPWAMCSKDRMENYKYIDNAHKKEVAQYWANWLNANCTEEFGHKIRIPIVVFHEGLELYR